MHRVKSLFNWRTVKMAEFFGMFYEVFF